MEVSLKVVLTLLIGILWLFTIKCTYDTWLRRPISWFQTGNRVYRPTCILVRIILVRAVYSAYVWACACLCHRPILQFVWRSLVCECDLQRIMECIFQCQKFAKVCGLCRWPQSPCRTSLLRVKMVNIMATTNSQHVVLSYLIYEVGANVVSCMC